MKTILFAFTLCILFAGCSNQDYVPLEDPLLTWDTLTFLQEGVEEISPSVGVSRGGGSDGSNGVFSSHVNRNMNFSFMFFCEPSEGSELMEKFRLHLTEALEGKGVSISKNEELAGTQLHEALEFSGSIIIGDEALRAKAWHSGFTIAYSRSEITGGISVGYKVDLDGRNFLQVSQIENQ